MKAHLKRCIYIPPADREAVLAEEVRELAQPSSSTHLNGRRHGRGGNYEEPVMYAAPQIYPSPRLPALHTPSSRYNAPDTQAEQAAFAASSHERPPKRPRLVYELSDFEDPHSRESSFNSPRPWSAESQHAFGSDLCRVFAACGFSWNAADNPELHRFFGHWLPGACVPDRRKLSGAFLDAAALKVKEKVVDAVRGKLATGQCDGWKNVAKTDVVASSMTVQRQVSVAFSHGRSGVGTYLIG